MGKKSDLQAEAENLGLDFTQRTTIAELEQMIHEAENPATDTRQTGDFICPVCRKVADHIHARGS